MVCISVPIGTFHTTEVISEEMVRVGCISTSIVQGLLAAPEISSPSLAGSGMVAQGSVPMVPEVVLGSLENQASV